MTPSADQAARNHALAIRQVGHAKRCYHDFDYFVQSFWYVVEPDKPLIWGWWLDAICKAVQRQQEGDPAYRWLLVMQPPGTAKSRIMSVLKPAWIWLRWPSRRMLYISTAQDVAARDSRYTRDVLKSSGWETNPDDPDMLRCGYRDVVATLHELGKKAPKDSPLYKYPLWDFAKDQDEKGNFANTRTGVRLCKPMGASITGERGDDVTIDDPVDFEEIRSAPPATIALNMASADTKARYVYTTRVNDRETSTRTMVMQRLDPDDPAGSALKDSLWKVLCVPMEYDPTHPHRMVEDPRTRSGEPLVGYTVEPRTRKQTRKPLQTDALKRQAVRDLGIVQYEAQYNQKPTRATGEFVTAADIAALERTADDPHDIARRADEVLITADFTFDDTANADRVALHAWAREGQTRFTLLARDTRRMNYPEMKRSLKALKQRFPQARRIHIEKAAAGPMIRADLESEIPGMVLVPTGAKSKWERAKVALQPLIKGRNIVLLTLDQAPWVAEVEASWLNMRPGGKDDDDVDAAAIMGAHWGLGGSTTTQAWLPASAALAQLPIRAPILDNVLSRPASSDRRYLVAAGPNPAFGTPTAWTVLDLTTLEEVATWAGTVDPLAQAKTLATLGRHYNNALLAVSSRSHAVVAALLRAGYPKVWQDAEDPQKHPGWYRTPADLERTTDTLARGLLEGRIHVRSPEGREHLLGWDGDPGSAPATTTARVWPYLIGADVMGRIGAYRAGKQANPIRDPETGAVRLSVYFGERARKAVI